MDDDATQEKEECPEYQDLTCNICFGPHSTDNLACRQCGHFWHAQCVLKTKSCPNCRSTDGYVKPRPYDQLIGIITSGRARCQYCNLLIKRKSNMLIHLSSCKKYELHLLRRIEQQRRVLNESMKRDIPQVPVELNPLLVLKTTTTVSIPDLRKESRKILIDIDVVQSQPPTHFEVMLSAPSDAPFPLYLSLLLADSVNTIPQFLCIPDATNGLRIPVIVAVGATFRIWLTAL